MVVGVALILEGKATKADVVEILEPFEVGDGDTTSVHEHVRDDEDVTFQQDLVSGNSCRPVGTFSDDLK